MHKPALVVVLAACAAARIAAANAIDTFDNSCFQAKAIETGLNFPFSIDRLSSEVVFGSSTLGFGGTGSLVAVPIGGGAVQTLLTGLAGPVTGVRLTADGQTIVVSHGNVNTHAIDFYDANSFAHLGGLTFNYPDPNWVHGTSALGIRDDPNVSGATDLFFNVGSEFGTHVGSLQVSVSGLVNASVDQAAAYELVFSRRGDSISASSLTEIGSGLRNAFGFEPLPNGDLLVTDNADAGRDELNLIAAGQIGTTVVNFGFVDINGCYIGQNGQPVGSGCVQPIFAPPTPEAVGATDVVLVPNGFGNLGGGYLLAYHGLQGSPSTQSVILYWNPLTNQTFPFLPNQPNVGHPDTMRFLDNHHLLIGDFSQNGLVGGSGTGTGQLIEISEAPEPRARCRLSRGWR